MQERNTNHWQRRLHRRRLINEATLLRDSCVIPLSPFVAPTSAVPFDESMDPYDSDAPKDYGSSEDSYDPKDSDRKDRDLLTQEIGGLMQAWWIWLDDCRKRILNSQQEDPSRYDFSVVDIALEHLAILRGIYGLDYKHCLSLLQEHKRERQSGVMDCE